MANIVVNSGLLRTGQNLGQSTNYSASRYAQTISVDDSSNAFAAGHDALDDGGAVSNEFDVALDATPTESSQTISYVATIPTGSGNFTIRRIALHDDTAANVTTSSTTLVAGADGQSFTKTSDFTVTITLSIAYTDNS